MHIRKMSVKRAEASPGPLTDLVRAIQTVLSIHSIFGFSLKAE